MKDVGLVSAEFIGYNADMEAYHAENAPRGDPALEVHRSTLVDFAANPRRWKDGYGFDGNKGTAHGSLVGWLVSGDMDAFTVKPETYTNDKGEEKPWNGNANVCKAWMAEHAGENLVSRKEYEIAETCNSRLRNHEDAGPVIASSQFEALVTGVYRDPDTGLDVPIKTSIDMVPKDDRALYDLKTAKSAEPHAWMNETWYRGYDM